MFRQLFGSLQNACENGVIIGHKMWVLMVLVREARTVLFLMDFPKC